MFTVEEMNLIQAMDHTCRRMAIFDIKTSIPNIEDHELKELCEKALKKMSAMTDADFGRIRLSATCPPTARTERRITNGTKPFAFITSHRSGP